MSTNIAYSTDELARHYAGHRRRFAEFYPSERTMFEAIAQGRPLGRVLDVGCAVAGLGLALDAAFGLTNYTGVEINAQCAALANAELADRSWFAGVHHGDIVNLAELGEFDLVASLGCADWNMDTLGILRACWSHVAPGGTLALTLRLVPGKGERRMETSWQDIVFADAPPSTEDVCLTPGSGTPERACYAVFGLAEALDIFASLSPTPSLIRANGYWGTPSPTAHTPFSRLVFTALALTKPRDVKNLESTAIELDWPADALAAALSCQL